jgi:hypothetical protein
VSWRWFRKSKLYRVEVRPGPSGVWYVLLVYIENGKTFMHSQIYDTGPEYAVERGQKLARDCGLRIDVIDTPMLNPVAAPFLPERPMAGPA